MRGRRTKSILTPLNQLSSGSGKACFAKRIISIRNVAGYHVPQDLLAVIGFMEERLPFVAWIVFVDTQDIVETVRLEVHKAVHGRLHEIIVHKG
jgi:hypothetical protein